jgi:hypothetical protein
LLGYGIGLPIEAADAEAIVAVFEQCTPNWELLMITSITEGADQISRDSADCVAETLDNDVARNIFVSELARDDQQPNAPPDALDYLATMIDAMESCLTTTELNALDFN